MTALMGSKSGEGLRGDARIVRRPLQEEVAARLSDLITQGALPAGSRLPEASLGLQLGVSRTPLREAVRMLAGEGLVELVPARGAIIRRITVQEMADSLVWTCPALVERHCVSCQPFSRIGLGL